MTKLVLVNFDKVSNSYSVISACKRLGYDPVLTGDFDQIMNATHVILPGVGSAASIMKSLQEKGLDDLIRKIAENPKQKILGICLGMQILTNDSNESQDGSIVQCLNIIPGHIRKFDENLMTVPHMGWNECYFTDHPIFKGLGDKGYVYFVHSYRYPETGEHSIATFEYGNSLHTAVIAKDNVIGIQFHPERSGDIGEQILKNFLEW